MATCRRTFLVVALFSCAVNVLMLTAPIFTMQVFDRVLSSRSEDTLITLLTIALFALAVLACLEATRGFLVMRLGDWLDARLGTAVFNGQIQRALDGEASAQALRDLGTVRGFISGPQIFPLLDAPWTPVFIAVLFVLHPWLGGLAALGAVALSLLAITNEFLTRGINGRAGRVSRQALREAETAARNADAIAAMGMTNAIGGRWLHVNDEALRLQGLAGGRSTVITALSKFLRMGLQVGIMALGAGLVLQDALSPGAMIAASILLGRALAPVDHAIGSWKNGLDTRNAYRRVRDHLVGTEPTADHMPLPSPTGAIRASGAGFVHPGHDTPALKAVNFALDPGETLCITGPTASGKTTLARLLVGNLRPSTGRIALDGVDIGEWDKTDLGRYIGYVPQTVELFPGTISDNIARLGEASPDRVIAAARLAGVHEMILKLPGGYDYRIGEGGSGLAGGQKQRIALARALYGDVRLLVLDEPNASLDSAGEAALANAIAAKREQGVTTIVIAHRPIPLEHVDKVLVLGDGEVIRFGPREEVLQHILASRMEAAQAEPTAKKPATGAISLLGKPKKRRFRRRPALVKG